MHKTIIGVMVIGLWCPAFGLAQDMSQEEFTDDDFAQFFGLIEDGKITREKMNTRCEKKVAGSTFAGKNLRHESEPERIEYNETGLTGTVDKRALRSRHFNLAFGEWTGSVFKPLCAGIWIITVNFSTTDDPTIASEKLADQVTVDIYLRQEGEARPGHSVMSAKTRGYGGNNQMTIALPLHTGDEISTWSEASGENQNRILDRVTFTTYKVGHAEKYMKAFDEKAWADDLTALK